MPIVEGTRRSGFAERATSGRGPTPSRHLALGCRQDYGPAPTWAARSHLSLAYAEQERFWKQLHVSGHNLPQRELRSCGRLAWRCGGGGEGEPSKLLIEIGSEIEMVIEIGLEIEVQGE